jgi:hypothetical protein
LVYDFNRIFLTDFALNEDIKVIRKNKEVAFENYVTSENNIGQRMRLINNEILLQIPHPQTLFDTHEAFYLFTELVSINYLLMIPGYQLTLSEIKEKFKTEYPVNWIEVDLKKCHTAFPFFPS